MKFDLEQVRNFLAMESPEDAYRKEIDVHIVLLNTCKSYIADANTELVTLPFSPFQRIRNWREKRKDDRLLVRHQQLQPQIHDAESSLRTVLVDVMALKDTLKDYAQECHSQLVACIDFTNKSLSMCEPIVEELRVVVDKVMLETLHLKAMLQFNIEIVKQVKFQMRVKALIPTWGSAGRGGGGRRVGRAGRANMQAIRDEVAQEDCTDDSDSQVALTRLVQLRKSRETCMRLLASSLESKETLSNNLSACIDCKNNLENKLRLDSRGLPASLDSAASIAEKEAKMNEQRMKDFLANENDSSYGGLDRTWYSSNCHIVCNNGRELLRRITLCTDLIFTSNEKLQHMVEVREDMNNLQLQGLHELLSSPTSHSNGSTPRSGSSSSGTVDAAATAAASGSAPLSAASTSVSPIAHALSAFSFGLLGSHTSPNSAKSATTTAAAAADSGGDGGGTSSSSSSSGKGGSVAADIQNAGSDAGGGGEGGSGKERDSFHSAKSSGIREGEREGDYMGESLSSRETLVSRHG